VIYLQYNKPLVPKHFSTFVYQLPTLFECAQEKLIESFSRECATQAIFGNQPISASPLFYSFHKKLNEMMEIIQPHLSDVDQNIVNGTLGKLNRLRMTLKATSFTNYAVNQATLEQIVANLESKDEGKKLFDEIILNNNEPISFTDFLGLLNRELMVLKQITSVRSTSPIPAFAMTALTKYFNFSNIAAGLTFAGSYVSNVLINLTIDRLKYNNYHRIKHKIAHQETFTPSQLESMSLAEKAVTNTQQRLLTFGYRSAWENYPEY
jgi:hypothetical protein